MASGGTIQNPSAAHVANATLDNTFQMSYALAGIVSIDTKQDILDPTVMAVNTPVPMFVDSDATDYCFVDKSIFLEYTPFIIPRQGQAASKDNTFQIFGSGTVGQMVRTENERVKLVFRDTLYIPDLLANLVSIRKFN